MDASMNKAYMGRNLRILSTNIIYAILYKLLIKNTIVLSPHTDKQFQRWSINKPWHMWVIDKITESKLEK